MSYFATWKRRREKRYQILYKRGPSTLAAIFAGMAFTLWSVFAILSSYPVGLYLYYTVLPNTPILLGKSLQETSKSITNQVKANVAQPTETISTVEISRDASLPDGHFLSIPKIGVDTQIWEAEVDNYESALKKGVWRTTDFATPDMTTPNSGKPVILAAHRFGYIDWTQAYRLKNSFYKLPNLKPGDEVEIVWNQHRYKYLVTKLEEGTAISDYSSDLIMYTCKYLVSPVRIFVYAKIIL